MTLKLDIQIDDPDAFYAALATALDRAEDPAALLSRLALILANQIGDAATLEAAIKLAASERTKT
ncbi:MAG TPA: DUF2783 domain-containing protein [Rhizomicrobium sp.]|jgi:hypothetical protein